MAANAIMIPFAPSLTIVIPAYNERDNLPRVVGEALTFARDRCRAAEVLVIDDGSTDGSDEVVASIARNHPAGALLRVVRHERNRGLTAALRSGFFGARNDFVTWIPADGQIALGELQKILDVWSDHDLVLSTYRRRDDGLSRKIMSRGLRLLLWATTGLRDRLEGVYLFRRALLDELALVSDRSAGSVGFEIAVKMRRLGKRIASTEIECAPRLSGRSKVANARNVLQSLGELWRIRRSLGHLRRTPTSDPGLGRPH
jgi:glycosyltransferase involved in cell wall biosynthesis